MKARFTSDENLGGVSLSGEGLSDSICACGVSLSSIAHRLWSTPSEAPKVDKPFPCARDVTRSADLLGVFWVCVRRFGDAHVTGTAQFRR